MLKEITDRFIQMPSPVRRYITFGFDEYSCLGGAADILGTFDHLEEAREKIEFSASKDEDDFQIYQIFDSMSGLVFWFENKYL